MYRGHSFSDPGPFSQAMRSAATNSSSLQLPRQLERPPFQPERTRQALISADPDLENVPLPFIRHSLRDKFQEMMNGRNSLSPSHLPTHCPAHLHPDLFDACAYISDTLPRVFRALQPLPPPLLRSERVRHLFASSNTPAPSPRAFVILYEYMYTQRLDSVLKKLIPLPPDFLQDSLSHTAVIEARDSKSTMLRLGMHLYACENGSISGLMNHASHVKDLWQDMVKLRMYMLDLWTHLISHGTSSWRRRQNPFGHRDFV
ncbi:hypothetical protein BDZ89DRAFT_1059448 [Hymenopellis radicata]|nr:hypothetical protein BDZ89DRAFT_1059448 [Hymenopellis radicata]